MKSLTTLILLVLATPAFASQVIDLGELEITGEIRRPNTHWIDGSKSADHLAKLHREMFERIEKDLLKHRKLAEIPTNLTVARDSIGSAATGSKKGANE